MKNPIHVLMDAYLKELPSEESMGIAARCWCEPTTSHMEMNSVLAIEFARALDKAIEEVNNRPFHPIPEDTGDLPRLKPHIYLGEGRVAPLDAVLNAPYPEEEGNA